MIVNSASVILLFPICHPRQCSHDVTQHKKEGLLYNVTVHSSTSPYPFVPPGSLTELILINNCIESINSQEFCGQTELLSGFRRSFSTLVRARTSRLESSDLPSWEKNCTQDQHLNRQQKHLWVEGWSSVN